MFSPYSIYQWISENYCTCIFHNLEKTYKVCFSVMPSRKIAIVTGGNKGIGFAIVKGLCENFSGDVYLTARNVARGREAVEKLTASGFNPLFHQLDITNSSSITAFADYIKTNNIKIDVLVNNAGVFASPTLSMGEQAELNVMVNYFGTLNVCQCLFPFLRENARVVNVSSSSGRLLRIPGTDVQAKFRDPNLSIEGLDKLMKQYIQDAKEGTYQSKGWGENAYVVSKVGVTALSIIQQKEFDQKPHLNISVNSVHPGYVDTDMTSHKGTLTIEEGAKAPLFLALEAEFKGEYVWFDCRVADWDGPAPQ